MRLGEIKERLMPLLEDALWAENSLQADDNPFTRRAYVRSMFSMVEGLSGY